MTEISLSKKWGFSITAIYLFNMPCAHRLYRQTNAVVAFA